MAARAVSLPGSEPPGPDGDWPHTGRFLPWALAGFMVMLWLVPFDAMNLPVQMPVDAKLDRVVILVIGAIWLGAMLAQGPASPRPRRSAVEVGIFLFVTTVGASILANVDALANRSELEAAIKNLALLLSYVFFFYMVVTTLRPAEVPRFVTLMLGLACITALGTIWEYRTEENLFYEWADKLFPGVSVDADRTGIDTIGRLYTNGPTGHAVAVATLLSMAVPFAVVSFLRSTERRWKAFYAIALVLSLSGALATARKTGALVPVAGLLVIALYRPRAMLRLAPLGLVAIIGIHALAPGAMGSIKGQLRPDRLERDAPVEGRKQDYAVVSPEIDRRPLMGRGYGSYDPRKYRFLDNQYLVLMLETGYVGTAAFILLVLLIIAICHRTIRSRHPERAPPALAVAATALSFAVASSFYDALAFPHVPYLLFFLAAVAATLRAELPETATQRTLGAAAWRASRRFAVAPHPPG
jgi:O-antigen ligase